MAINLRSPYVVNTAIEGTAYATLDISIWEGSSLSPVTAQYSLRKTASGLFLNFEISELVRDYLEITFSGSYSGQAVWVQTVHNAYDSTGASVYSNTTTQSGFEGYSYFEDQPINPNNYSLFMSNKELFVLKGNVFRIPIHTVNSPTIVFYKDGEVVAAESFIASSESSNQIKYVSIYGDNVNWDTFQERVTDDGSEYESNACLQAFFDSQVIGTVDKITVSDVNGLETINVNTLEECKYEPKKVTFINKFGALQDMYFFKKVVETMNVSKESYKANATLDSGAYDNSSHVNRDFNVLGKESISLSSGFLSEDYNEVFKQMMLSEKVWVTNIVDNKERVSPINLKTSDITYKTSLNNKLVEYTIEFDKSYDTINNIR
tara:strand:+ start:861 stop:1991 length:1131 start_codon:yes stop_codon:yes gene_type:complete